MAQLAELPGYEQALERARAYTTPRSVELTRLGAYVKGTQYAGKPHWLSPRDDVPLLERAPHVVDPIVAKAISSHVDMLVGEGRWPTITAGVDEDEAPFDSRLGLDDVDSETVDRGIRSISRQARIKHIAAQAIGEAMSCGTAVTLACVVRGQLRLKNLPAKHCEPEWASTGELAAVDVRYPYLERYYDGEERRWRVRSMLYRRRIDAEADTTFRATPAAADGSWPQRWQAQRRAEHGLGFAPVVWWAFQAPTKDTGDDDGCAIHVDLTDEIDALNRACSQHDRAALYAGDPQIVETNVEPGHNPAPSGRRAVPMRSYLDEDPATRRANAQWVSGATGQAPARRKGPSVIWTYPVSEHPPKVELLTLPGDALESVGKNRDDLRASIADALAWVRTGLSELSGPRGGTPDISGEAMAWLYRKQTARCDTYRADFEDNWLRPVLGVLLRIVLHYGSTGQATRLYLAGLQDTANVVRRFVLPVLGDDGETMARWFEPPLRVKWPEYFPRTAADNKRVSQQTRDDYDAGLITLRTAVERIATIYGIEDVDAYVEELEDSKRERMGSLHQAIGALNAEAREDSEALEQGPSAEPSSDARNRGDDAPGARSGARGSGS